MRCSEASRGGGFVPEIGTPLGTVIRMRVAVGSDHAGFELKSRVVGASSEESADYPLYAELAARLVAGGEAERGVVVCGSGVGVSIAANKVDGIRAVNARDAEEAEIGRRHNDANVLALAGRRLGERDAAAILRAFLAADFEGGRHGRPVDQIAAIERRSQ